MDVFDRVSLPSWKSTSFQTLFRLGVS
jgi:hypothetical protein